MATWKRVFLTTASLLLLIYLLPGCGVPKEEYNQVRSDLLATGNELIRVSHELAQRNAEVGQLEGELGSLKNQYNRLQDSYDELEDRYIKLGAEHTATLIELEQSLPVPYTAISGRQISWVWQDTGGKLHKWTLSIDSYRNWIEIPEPNETMSLSCSGRSYTVADFRPYVRTEGFNEVIPSFYQQCADEEVFAREAFNLVTQLTVYSDDIGEVARWPVETLTEGGGDCEDLSILFASLLKAAPYPYKLNLVYLDADNPTDPQRPNHVIVKVETDDWAVFAECTSEQGWGYYERVNGWFFEL